jgi:hypothetical protein
MYAILRMFYYKLSRDALAGYRDIPGGISVKERIY